jgi:hypothetical protein
MRERAAELATEWLGARTEREIQQSLHREVGQERWTSLDRRLQREAREGLIRLNQPAGDHALRQQRVLLTGRLQHLQRMDLAYEQSTGVWVIRTDAEQVLRAMGERGDIVRTMQRAMSGMQRDLAIFVPGGNARPVVGRVAAKGMADELSDRGYLVIDGVDGKAHYVALNARTELEQYPVGAVVEARGSAAFRTADKTIASLAVDGHYRTDHHLAIARTQDAPGRDPVEVVNAHVRRLEALRRAGKVERVAEGVWRIPADLPEQGRQYDVQRLEGVSVELRSHLTIERQTRVVGATWLDQQLIGGAAGIGDKGFGSDIHEALRQRVDFLVEQGLAERRGQRVILSRNLLGTLRSRDIEAAAKTIATETGLIHRNVTEGERVSGIYRRSVLLASGRFAMLEDGMGFSLVPWKPVIEQRLGQSMTAVMRGGSVSWNFGRPRGHNVG